MAVGAGNATAGCVSSSCNQYLIAMSSLIRRIPSGTLVIGLYIVIIAFALLATIFHR